MGTTRATQVLQAEIRRLRASADRAQREGDLATASNMLYGEIPELESALQSLAMIEASDRSEHHWILRGPGERTWVAVPLQDVSVPRPAESKRTSPGAGWMHVGEALSLEERRCLILEQVQRALRRGDMDTADELETGALSSVDDALATQRCFRLVHDDGRRLILQDGNEIRWIAIELDEALPS